MPSWQSTSRIGCPIDNPARRSRGAAPSTRPQWTRVPLDFRPRWRYVVNKAGAANAAPALKYKFYFTPHFCGYTEFGIVPMNWDFCFSKIIFFVVCLTYGWRRSWNRIRGSPARFSTRWSICNTLSGDIGPPLGDGNTHSLLPVFLLCCIRTLIASADRGRVR